MKKDVKQAMLKNIDKKKEIERLSNKSLTVFTVVLVFEVLLIFISSGLTATGSMWNAMNNFVTAVCAITFVTFIGLLVSSFVVKNKKGGERTVKVLKDWSFASLATSVGAFIIALPTVLPEVAAVFGLRNLGGAIAVKLVPFSGANASYVIMALLAVYVIISFIYFNIKSKQIKKSK